MKSIEILAMGCSPARSQGQAHGDRTAWEESGKFQNEMRNLEHKIYGLRTLAVIYDVDK